MKVLSMERFHNNHIIYVIVLMSVPSKGPHLEDITRDHIHFPI
jgi:hypothetical protein